MRNSCNFVALKWKLPEERKLQADFYSVRVPSAGAYSEFTRFSVVVDLPNVSNFGHMVSSWLTAAVYAERHFFSLHAADSVGQQFQQKLHVCLGMKSDNWEHGAFPQEHSLYKWAVFCIFVSTCVLGVFVCIHVRSCLHLPGRKLCMRTTPKSGDSAQVVGPC